MESIIARCFKCRKDVELSDVKNHTTPNGRILAKGKCQGCGGQAGRFIPLPKAPKPDPITEQKISL